MPSQRLAWATFPGKGSRTISIQLKLNPQVPIPPPEGLEHPPPCPDAARPDHSHPAGHHQQARHYPQTLRLCQRWLRPPCYCQSLSIQIQVDGEEGGILRKRCNGWPCKIFEIMQCLVCWSCKMFYA